MDKVLNELDIESPTWKKIEKALRERLAGLREANDNTMHETDTAKLRGRISEVKNLLALAELGPAQQPDADQESPSEYQE